jgi:protein-disulfide isomerase
MLLQYKLVSIFIIGIFIVTISQKSVNGEWKIPTNPDELANNLSTYESKLIKIDYPSTWNITETKESIIFAPTNNSTNEIKINIISLPSDSLSIKSIVDSTLNQFVRTLDDFELLESTHISNIKDSNHKLVYSYLDKNKNKIQQMDIGLIQGTNLYVISLISKYIDFYHYLPIYEEMLTSFNFYNEQRLLNQFSSYLINPVADFVPILGNSSNITMVEFGDYQCTFCAKFHNEVREKIINNFVNSGKISFLFKDYIVNDNATDTSSTKAAEASYCAAEQNKYWNYHDELYDNWAGEKTGWITDDSLQQFARNIQVPDIEKFSNCLQSNEYLSIVQSNDNIARSMGLTGTPSFILLKDNNIQSIIPGALPYEIFEQTLNKIISN